MSKTVLQIPLETTLRNDAEKAAIAAGFSSVQEVVRVFLMKLATQKVGIGFYEQDVMLSAKSEKRYATMINDIKRSKNITGPISIDDLASVLNE